MASLNNLADSLKQFGASNLLRNFLRLDYFRHFNDKASTLNTTNKFFKFFQLLCDDSKFKYQTEAYRMLLTLLCFMFKSNWLLEYSVRIFDS